MGISLNGLTPAGTYPGLIKTGDNTAISGTPKVLSDGNGNNLPMEVSTTGVNFTNNLTQGGVAVPTASQVAAKQDTLVSGTNIKTINGVTVLGSGDIVTPFTPPSGVSGAIQFSTGSAFGSDAANLFWDDTNNRLGIGTNAPSQALQLASGVARFRDLLFGQAAADAINNTSLLTLKWNGNTGIAVSHSGGISAASTFHIKGSGSTSATTSLLVQNSAGLSSLQVNDAGSVFNLGGGSVAGNTAFGDSALIDNLTSANNTAIGKSALENNTAANNTAVGFEAALTNTTGTGITAIGYQALYANTTGGSNTALGTRALGANTTGNDNTAIGLQALFSNTQGSSNTANGRNALLSNTTGSSNTANGVGALFNNTTSNNNTANGFQALLNNITGSNNTALGTSALQNNTVSNNVAVGFRAAFYNTTGTGITAIGYQALTLSTGINNTAIGFQAGDNITTGAGNVCIGSGAEPLSATASNQFVVGSSTVNAGSVTTESNLSLKVWNVIINGVAQKILLA